ncbi:MAG: Ig-like domain-containing protein [Anaerolineae bacterium]|nr:MAG: Ig-like domain-containing protein [Anaerolineae bacterium]
MRRAGRASGRVWRVWVACSLILSILPLLVVPAIADERLAPYFDLVKVADPSPVLTFSPLTFELTIQNTGTADSETITITDTVPSAVTLESIGKDGVLDGGVVVWTIDSLALADSASVTFTVRTGNTAGEVINESYGVTSTNAITSTYGVPLTTSVLPGIVINEIMQNPAAVDDAVGEWFELYNPTDAAVDMDGWTIRDTVSDTHTISGSFVIPPRGYVVLGINGDPAVNGGVDVGYVYSNFFLGDGSDEIVLSDADGHEIDRVEYDGGLEFPDPDGASMELSDPAADNNVGSNWAAATVAYSCGGLGTPGGPNDQDTRPPLVCDTLPADGATDVEVYATVSAAFSEAMDESSLGLTLTGPEGAVAGSVSYDSGSLTATFDPDDALNYGTTYTATVAAGLEDAAGNVKTDAYAWHFSTLSDTDPPRVLSTDPADGAIGTSVTTDVSATFDEAIDESTLYLTLTGPGGALAGSVSYDPGSFTATFDPDDILSAGTTYTATVSGTVTDLAGNPMGAAYVWHFTTTAGHPPEAAFTVSNDYPVVGEVVTFTNRSEGDEPLTYAWDFGDGETSGESDPAHTYDAPGVYTVSLTATNLWGVDTATAQVHVGYPPVASFYLSPTVVSAGEVVRFTNESTGTEPLSYSWDFGDGSPASGERDPAHVYSLSGNYTVVLTVANPWGVDTATASVSVSGWDYICAPQRIEITGIGMGDHLSSINPQTLSLAEPASVSWLLAQVAGRYRHDTSTPERVTLTTDAPQSITFDAPSRDTPHGYTYEADLLPTRQITAFVSSNPEDILKTPRGLILYASRAAGGEWTSVGKTMNHYVSHGVSPSHTEILAFPALATATDLSITAVVIDNDEDDRPLVLEATAGGVTGSLTELGPTKGASLSLPNLTLQQVPVGTSQVSVTLRSPVENGDSLVWVGLNASFPCAVPALRGVVGLQGRSAKPSPSWSIPLTVWLSPAGSPTLAYTLTTTTDQRGEFDLALGDIAPGMYDVRVKGDHTLRNLARDVSLVAGDNYYFFGRLLEGDAETADTFNQVLMPDALVVLSSFGMCRGEPGFVASADLDESGCVLLPDLGLLAGNFGREGDIVIAATLPVPPTSLQAAGSSALVAFDIEEMTTRVGEVVALALDIDPRHTPVNGAAVQLNFDPALVEVLAVNLTDQLPLVIGEPLVDNVLGVVRFAVGALDRAVAEEFSIARLTLRVKAATDGTAITFDDGPLTDVVGSEGSVPVERRGIMLKAGPQGKVKEFIRLPIVIK